VVAGATQKQLIPFMVVEMDDVVEVMVVLQPYTVR
jgi:hypothetical protein